MPNVNDDSLEIQFKFVFWGPPRSGKRTNLVRLQRAVEPDCRSELVTSEAGDDLTVHFDYWPPEPVLRESYQTRFLFYTVTGDVVCNATRELVLRGADGLVFVADADPARWDANLESWNGLAMTLQDLGRDLDSLALAIQVNKRDLPTAVARDRFVSALIAGHRRPYPFFDASTRSGEGVLETIEAVSTEVLRRFHETDRIQPPVESGGDPSPMPRRRAALDAASW